MAENEVVEEEVTEVEEPKEVSEVLADTLNEMRSEEGTDDEPTTTPVVEEGEPEADTAAPEEEDEEAWLAKQSDRSQERYRSLAERAKKAEEEATEIRAQGMQLYRLMGDAGVSPDDLTSYFEYYRNVKGGDKVKAAEYWGNLEKNHSNWTGQAVGNADPLNNHPDLKKAVGEYEITEEVARETASLRDYSVRMQQMEQRQAEFNAQYGAQQREQQEAATYAQQASVELDKWSDEMKTKDPNFAQKEALLLERAQESFPNIHPAHWPAFVAKEYAYISKAMPGVEKKVSPNPVRPGGNSKGAVPEAKNISDALSNALREMRG